MKSKLLCCFLAVFLLTGAKMAAQSYIGYSVDNYSGIHGVVLNPASVVDSRFRADINLISVSAFGGSDYFGLDVGALSDSGFDFEGSSERIPTDKNQFFLNADILGPSFMFNLNKRSSIAVTSRVRAFMNFNNVNGMLFENIYDGFEQEDFNFDMENLSGTIHAWGEVGLTYGRILINSKSNFLKGGVTLKYLLGAGSTFINSPLATGQYDPLSGSLTTSGSLAYGSSLGFDSDDIDFSNASSGFGGDIGFVYEYRPNRDTLNLKSHSRYKLKLGVSVTDLGSISYDGTTITEYNIDGSVNADRFDEEDLETVLEEAYPGTETVVKQKINLPTALHVVADYSLTNHLFVSAHGSLSLVSADSEMGNRIINTVTLSPRFETKWLSFYLPMSLRQYDKFAMGAGLRLGPLSVGSGSLITNYLGDSSKTTDVFVGLKIPIYR